MPNHRTEPSQDSWTESSPYVGPKTYTEEQAPLFFGRQREAQDLLARVLSERLVLFYAQSGAGKSSPDPHLPDPGSPRRRVRRAASRPGGRRPGRGVAARRQHLPAQPDAGPRPCLRGAAAAPGARPPGLPLGAGQRGRPPLRLRRGGRIARARRALHRADHADRGPVRGADHPLPGPLARARGLLSPDQRGHAAGPQPLGPVRLPRGLPGAHGTLRRLDERPDARPFRHGAHGRGGGGGGGAGAGPAGRATVRTGCGGASGGRSAPGARLRPGRAGRGPVCGARPAPGGLSPALEEPVDPGARVDRARRSLRGGRHRPRAHRVLRGRRPRVPRRRARRGQRAATAHLV